MYTGYLTGLAAQPGHYTVRVFVSDNRGQAAAPSRRGEHTFNCWEDLSPGWQCGLWCKQSNR